MHPLTILALVCGGLVAAPYLCGSSSDPLCSTAEPAAAPAAQSYASLHGAGQRFAGATIAVRGASAGSVAPRVALASLSCDPQPSCDPLTACDPQQAEARRQRESRVALARASALTEDEAAHAQWLAQTESARAQYEAARESATAQARAQLEAARAQLEAQLAAAQAQLEAAREAWEAQQEALREQLSGQMDALREQMRALEASGARQGVTLNLRTPFVTIDEEGAATVWPLGDGATSAERAALDAFGAESADSDGSWRDAVRQWAEDAGEGAEAWAESAAEWSADLAGDAAAWGEGFAEDAAAWSSELAEEIAEDFEDLWGECEDGVYFVCPDGSGGASARALRFDSRPGSHGFQIVTGGDCGDCEDCTQCSAQGRCASCQGCGDPSCAGAAQAPRARARAGSAVPAPYAAPNGGVWMLELPRAGTAPAPDCPPCPPSPSCPPCPHGQQGPGAPGCAGEPAPAPAPPSVGFFLGAGVPELELTDLTVATAPGTGAELFALGALMDGEDFAPRLHRQLSLEHAGAAAHTETDAVLDELRALVQEMRAEVQVLRSDLRDLRSTVHAEDTLR